jgi:hypothetical protein
MRAIKIVSLGSERDVSTYDRHTESGKTTRAVIGHIQRHILVEIEGKETLWKLQVPEGFLEELTK